MQEDYFVHHLSCKQTLNFQRCRLVKYLLSLLDDPAAEDDIANWARRLGHEVIKMEKNGNEIRFEIKKIK